MCLDCRFWNLFNINLNYQQRLDLLQELQAEELPLVELACELAILQMKNGRFFLMENRQRSQLWKLPCVLGVEAMPSVWKTTLDIGAFGATVQGHRVAKQMTFLSNIPDPDQVINKRLSSEEKYACTPPQGKLTRPNQEYPDQLVTVMLKHLKQIVHLHEPQRFAFQHVLAIAQPTTSLSAWNDLVDHISSTFERSSKRPSNIDVGHVARLHINLRHPSPQDLTRMVAYYGGAPSSITTCIQHLRCSTCDRLKSPQQPRPTTMPKFIAGQFGDEIQGGIFYLRLLSTEAVPILGLVDKATGFHQAAICQTRNSAQT